MNTVPCIPRSCSNSIARLYKKKGRKPSDSDLNTQFPATRGCSVPKVDSLLKQRPTVVLYPCP